MSNLHYEVTPKDLSVRLPILAIMCCPVPRSLATIYPVHTPCPYLAIALTFSCSKYLGRLAR